MWIYLFGVVAAYELLQAGERFRERQVTFRRAQDKANQLGRPLVVVGDPDSGGHTRLKRAYPCGDLCVDLNGCPNCSNQVAVDLTKGQIPVDDNSAVVFVSCVLEYVDDLPAAWRELKRASGSLDNLFVVTVSSYTLAGWLFPGAKWQLKKMPQGGYTARRISDSKRDGSLLGEARWN